MIAAGVVLTALNNLVYSPGVTSSHHIQALSSFYLPGYLGVGVLYMGERTAQDRI